jgi:hypothetical protein
MDWTDDNARWACFADDGAGSAGGAAAAVAGAGGAAGGGADDGAGGAGDGAGAGDGGGAGGDGGTDPEWLGIFSAEGGDAANPSNRDWLKAKGFKTADDAIRSYRDAEKALRNGGKISVPGDKATAEEVAAFRTAIGVPEAADRYEFAMPQDEEVDASFADPMKKIAHEAGVPANAFKALAEGFIAWQADTLEATRTAEDQDAATVLTGWGEQRNAKLADVQRAMRALELTADDVAGIQRGFALVGGKPGSARTLELLQRLGAGMAEDSLIFGGGAQRRFGITGAEAQAEVDKLIADEEFGRKLRDKDPEAVARWSRLNAAIAADVDRKDREEARANM